MIDPSHPARGALRTSRTRGEDAVDADSVRETSARESGRRSRVVLTPRRWRQVARIYFRAMTVARKPVHRGEHGISRKPSRRESRDASAALYARVRTSVHIAHETAGAACTRLSLRPLFYWGAKDMQTSGASRRGNAVACMNRCSCCTSSIRPRAWWCANVRTTSRPRRLVCTKVLRQVSHPEPNPVRLVVAAAGPGHDRSHEIESKTSRAQAFRQ
jgi:hypothetical protein